MSTKRPSGRGKTKPLAGEEHLRLRPGSPDWQIDFTIEGRRFRASSWTENKALAAAAAVKAHEAAYREIVLGERAAVHMTVNDAFVRFWDEVAQHTTYGRGNQRYTLNLLLGLLGAETPLTALTDERIARLVGQLRAPRAKEDRAGRPETLSNASVNRYLQCLSVVCRRAREVWGVECGQWDKARHTLAEPQGREVFLTQDQGRALMGAAVGHLRPILMLELLTGLRMRNAVQIRWEEISLDLGRALLIQKGNRRLTVTLPAAAVEMLARIEPDPPRRVGPVFHFGNPAVPCACSRCGAKSQYRGDPIRAVKRSFATAARNANVAWDGDKRLRFHDLRHTVASWLLGLTGDLVLVKEQLGHRDVGTTQRYSHLLPGRRESAAEALASALLDPTVAKKRLG